jgi:hypothetical protein
MTQTKTKAEKTDFYRERPDFFRASKQPQFVDLPEASFLVVDGSGSPDDASFKEAIGALYSTAYTLKMAAKKSGRDYKVPTFEGAWWIYSGDRELPREQWRWQLSMMVPDFIDAGRLEAAARELAARGKAPGATVRLERIRLGTCVQVLHVGPYEAETESIEKMKAFMATSGLSPEGPHREVYLGDPTRAKPEALKTLLRQQVRAL